MRQVFIRHWKDLFATKDTKNFLKPGNYTYPESGKTIENKDNDPVFKEIQEILSSDDTAWALVQERMAKELDDAKFCDLQTIKELTELTKADFQKITEG